ncbi:signal peptidase I [Singulisphaera sp. PoT]|uniref:signal peptidase I n=1 Tax=Singulisphaera sp. PoT TaxID=3411797 RepID=UPI003BF4601C
MSKLSFLSTKRSKRLGLLALVVLGSALWMLRGTLAHATALRVFQIPSGSMAPTLKAGDRIFVDTLRDATPARGELWLFTAPASSIFVKRVIGLPGETVEVVRGQVMIDGKPLSEPYLASPVAYDMPPLTLKAEEYFMLGDSRAASNDSHIWGPVPLKEFVGRATYRCWPPARVGGLPLPTALSKLVPLQPPQGR